MTYSTYSISAIWLGQLQPQQGSLLLENGFSKSPGRRSTVHRDLEQMADSKTGAVCLHASQILLQSCRDL